MNEKNWFNQFSLIVDQNKQGIRIGIYAVTVTGLIYVFRSVRPFQKFRHARQVPQTFLERKLKLNGSVNNIEIGSPVLLRVDHNPIFGSRLRRKSNPGLGVSIHSICVSSNGISWLQHMLLGRCIQFTLLKKQDDHLCSIVYLDKANVGEELLKLGFATVDSIDFDLQDDESYMKYYQNLLKLEDKAEKKRLGIWSSGEYSAFEKVKNGVVQIFFKLFYKFRGS